jgi:hypothetical protein
MVEHAPEAIVVSTVAAPVSRNQHACDLYGVPMGRLAELTRRMSVLNSNPAGRSSELAREKMAEALCRWHPLLVDRSPMDA